MMKRKRLDRGDWIAHNQITSSYHQLRVDIPGYTGLAGVIFIKSGAPYHWELPKAGKAVIICDGMTWLQLIPDGQKRVIWTMFLPDGAASVWYVDIIDSLEYDDDGVAVFIDKYLDVIFTPQGDVIIDDRDELDDAFGRGELSEKQHKEALRECDSIIDELCSDVAATKRLHSEILRHVTGRVKNGEESPIQKETNYGNVR